MSALAAVPARAEGGSRPEGWRFAAFCDANGHELHCVLRPFALRFAVFPGGERRLPGR